MLGLLFESKDKKLEKLLKIHGHYTEGFYDNERKKLKQYLSTR